MPEALTGQAVDGRDKEIAALAPRFDMVRAVDWDPEGVFRMGLFLAQAGDLERAVSMLDRSVTRGYEEDAFT